MKLSKTYLSALLFLVASCGLPLSENIDPSSGWDIVVETLDDTRTETTLACDPSTARTRKRPGSVTYVFDNVGDLDIRLSVKCTKSKGGQALELRPTVSNNEKGVFVKFCNSPEFEFACNLDSCAMLIPCGVGRRISKNPSRELPGRWEWKEDEGAFFFKGKYPGNLFTMQWIAFDSVDHGFYFASHDPRFTGKSFKLKYKLEDHSMFFNLSNSLDVFPGETVEACPIVYYAYKGNWHVAANTYREFYDENCEIEDSPDWVKHSTGWLLTMIKQQNAEVMWHYDNIGKEITRIADDRGLDMLMLFGWTVGGHDRFYPEYVPDPELGGVEGLKNGIKEAKEKGKRVILYANGQLMDQNGTDFWDETGRNISVRLKDNSIFTRTYHKYYDSPARTFGLACQSAREWKDKLLELAMQANDFGADGILFDQLATGHPEYCYSPDHGHRVPAITYENDKFNTLKHIRDTMREINPEFVILTEGLMDSELNSISIFHGLSFGYDVIWPSTINNMINGSHKEEYFPQMFKYTFPEWVSTNRIGAPAYNRATANYMAAFGFRSDLECRYAPDIPYCLEDKVPAAEDYDRVINKSKLEIILKEDPVACRTYLKQVLDFMRTNADLFYYGRFVDNEGFSIDSSEPCIATSFNQGNKKGVLVWNVSYESSLNYSIEAPGYRFVSISSPEKSVSQGDEIMPQSIHLIIFEKN